VNPAPSLIHRYSFNETSGTTAADSVGGSSWNGTLNGTAAFDGVGQVVLDGNTNAANYVSLPAGILSGLDDVTIEAWASFGATITNNFENLWAFGFSDTDELDPSYGLGGDYITFQPITGAGTAAASYGPTLPGNTAPTVAVINNTLSGQNNMHVVVVVSPTTGTLAMYTNGVFGASASLFNVLLEPIAFRGPLFTNASSLARTLGADLFNYIGKSLYFADPGMLGSVNEFRIYSGPLTASQVAANNALGPNQLVGSSTSTSLNITPSGSNATLSWPTNSALVTLVSSPTLGTGAAWTPVIGGLAVSGSNYQITVPAAATARFFRLRL